ncbi:unnamed protein product [Vicia faba]|uniref:Uncharacterized protein n=1 Tax=Vicia faba TaxID=3906 RepID=A0AAV0YI55_VICFA|nr:unnamed protein product [Vicia faba]
MGWVEEGTLTDFLKPNLCFNEEGDDELETVLYSNGYFNSSFGEEKEEDFNSKLVIPQALINLSHGLDMRAKNVAVTSHMLNMRI